MAQDFRTIISMKNGEPVIGWEPRLAPEKEAKRTYTIEGRSSLTEDDWEELKVEGGESKVGKCRFFRVKVTMP